MTLSCSCNWDDFDYGPGDVLYRNTPNDYSQLARKRSTSCSSCGSRIAPGDTVVTFTRYKVPEYEIEETIYGDSGEDGPERAPHHLCETCGDLYFSLIELGFECTAPTENMHELVKEYAETYGPAASVKGDTDNGN